VARKFHYGSHVRSQQLQEHVRMRVVASLAHWLVVLALFGFGIGVSFSIPLPPPCYTT
jgi:hypothetical protein